jgi:UDP-3-O-[3-hydroxymyristoyl] glucosamine N-acyltransferase
LEGTVVGHKVMLDNFSIIAHNVVIGDATAMAAFCQVAGSPNW